MDMRSILIVDDEKNIRFTLSQAMETLGMKPDTAVNGEEALHLLEEKNYDLILLDLKMPGMDGMDVLHRLRKIRPEILVIIITAYGTIESAVEAIKYGAVDFIQKPFVPDEIRELVSRVLDREKIELRDREEYRTYSELAKRSINERRFEAAIAHLHKAIAIDPCRPEAFNLLGALLEIRGDFLSAQKNYRAALSLDPTYKPAADNLHRSTRMDPRDRIKLGDVGKEEVK